MLMALQCAKAFARDYGGAYEVNAQNIWVQRETNQP